MFYEKLTQNYTVPMFVYVWGYIFNYYFLDLICGINMSQS